MPLRRLYILKLKLTFPSAVAAAYTIRSLHVGRNAAVTARKKTLALIASFLLAVLWRITSQYAPGIMWDWHIGWWFYKAGWKWIIAAENWVCVPYMVFTSQDNLTLVHGRAGYGNGRLPSSAWVSLYP